MVLGSAPIACAKEIVVELSTRSSAMHASVSDVRVFAFDVDPATGRLPGCDAFDPRGLPFGDAEARTSFTAAFKTRNKFQDTIGTLSSLHGRPYTLVVEGWGAPCDMMASGPDKNGDVPCLKVKSGEPTVLRGYACEAIDLAHGPASVSLDVEPLVPIGSVMEHAVDVGAMTDPMHPLPLADGLAAQNRLAVKLIDPIAQPMDRVKVRWSIEAGDADVGPQPDVSAIDPDTQADGISTALIRAGGFASSKNNGKIVVSAYAPGFEGSPIDFDAVSVASVEIESQTIDLASAGLGLGAADAEYQPVLVEDADGDSLADVIIAGATPNSCDFSGLETGPPEAHRIAVLYGKAEGGFDLAPSRATKGELNAMVTARLDASGHRALLAFSSDPCNGPAEEVMQGMTPRFTFTAKHPRIEIFRDLAGARRAGGLTLSSTVVDEARCIGGSCTTVQGLTKKIVAAASADLDGDGIDEIAVSRCGFVFEPVSGQDPRVRCRGTLNSFTDAEIALFRGDPTAASNRFQTIALINSRGDDGGFRELRFADVNGDQSLDIVFAVEDRIGVSCGNSNLRDSGFGFSDRSTMRSDATTHTSAFSPGPGHFIAGRGIDSVITGAFKAEGKTSGFNLAIAEACSFPTQAPAVFIDERSFDPRALITRIADLNQDGFDDALILQREKRHLLIYFGTGTEGLARGPEIDVPSGFPGELGLFVESRGQDKVAVAATTDPAKERVLVYRIRPRKP